MVVFPLAVVFAVSHIAFADFVFAVVDDGIGFVFAGGKGPCGDDFFVFGVVVKGKGAHFFAVFEGAFILQVPGIGIGASPGAVFLAVGIGLVVVLGEGAPGQEYQGYE